MRDGHHSFSFFPRAMKEIIYSVKGTTQDGSWICLYRCTSHSLGKSCHKCRKQRVVESSDADEYVKYQMSSGYPDPLYTLVRRGALRVENGQIFRLMKYEGFPEERLYYKPPMKSIPARPSLCEAFRQLSVTISKPSKLAMTLKTSRASKTCCDDCGVGKTPLWRHDRLARKTFCNACGIRRKRHRSR